MKHFRKSILALALMAACTLQAQTVGNKIPAPDAMEQMRLNIVYAQIKQFYVDNKNDDKLIADAIRGMVAGLDPHSVYLDKEALDDFASQTEGNFEGIGVEITMDNGMVKVISPIDGTPAQLAGIKAGDYIVAVNDQPIIDMQINKIVKVLRGKPGSKVTITVLSQNDKKPRQLTLVRQSIHMNSVRSELLENKYGYIRISQFQSDTGAQVAAAIKQLQKSANGQLAGIVLDLRNDPGGLLDEAIKVTDTFLDSNKLGKNKMIVYTKGRFKQSSEVYNAKPGDLTNGLPLVILINQGSASASEIVAGALQDQKRALLVGQRSFGKGSVQTLLPVDDHSAVKLTTALYYTPSGRSIQAEGIVPDILVEELQVKQNNDEALIFTQIREAALTGHLQNGNKPEAPTTPIKAAPSNKPVPPPKPLTTIVPAKDVSKLGMSPNAQLALKDYQLSEALNVLKTLTIMKKVGPIAGG